MAYDLSKFAKKQEILPDTLLYGLTLNRWAFAAVVAGLESLLEHDATMHMMQRNAIRDMVTDFRAKLGLDIPTLEAEEAPPVDYQDPDLPGSNGTIALSDKDE